jgi:thiol-disulfide isomerase/thioredoxin
MKKLLTSILTSLFTVISFSQTVIENPRHGLSSATYVKIVRVELKDSSVVLWFHTASTPGTSISIPERTYIVPSGSSQKLFIRSTDGIPLGKSITLPPSGVIDYKLIFPKIEPGLSSIDYGEEGGTWHIYDIVLKDIPSKAAIPDELRGHWFNTENGEWEISLLDTVVVYQKKLWNYAGVKFKNHEGSISIKNKNSKSELTVKLDKDGHLILRTSSKTSFILGRDALTIRKALKGNEDLFSPPAFKYDSVAISGYLKGYSPRIGSTTGTIYVNNLLTSNQDNYLIRLSDNGYFSVKIPFYYPHEVFVRSELINGILYLEPGKDLFIMIDPELSDLPLFMGENALLNSDLHELRKINAYNYEDIQEHILNMSPDMYKTYITNLKDKELRMLDSLTKSRPFTAKAIQVRGMSIFYRHAYNLMDYNMAFEGVYRRINKIPSTQRSIQVKIEKPGADFYDFVTDDLTNNPLAILTNEYYYFINRLKYNELMRTQTGGYTPVELGRELELAGFTLTEEEKAMMADLESNLIPEASHELNAFMQKYGNQYSDFNRKYSQHLSEMSKISKEQRLTASDIEKYLVDHGVELTNEEKEMLKIKSSIDNSEGLQKNRELLSRYKTQMNNFNANHSKEISLVLSRRTKVIRNENLEKTFGVHKGFASDIMESQDECRTIVAEATPLSADKLQIVLKPITTPFISWYIEKCNNESISKIAADRKKQLSPGNKLMSVVAVTPTAKADVLFETIMNKYKGKVVYVDFWATWCGPCRSENERIKPLKEALAGKDIVFVYITNPTSPKETYDNMIPGISGEHYRLTSDEWNFLSNKFNISGIPHKVLVDKKGVVTDPNLMYMDNSTLQMKLEKLLNN